MVEISTSILSVEKEQALKTFYDLEVAGTSYYHVDVMDGKFVEADTQEKMYEYTSAIKQISNLPLDVHLMVENIKESIDKYLPFEPSIITFHYEACSSDEQVIEIINYLKKNGVKPAISIKPKTDIESIKKFLPLLHMVLIMTVEPGKGGQKLIPETIEKVSELKDYLKNEKLDTYIEVDGGIKTDNANLLKIAGADILVSGSGIISSDNMKEVIEKMTSNI